MIGINWFILVINFCWSPPTCNLKLNNLNFSQRISRFIFNARPGYFLGVFCQGTVGRTVNEVNPFSMLSLLEISTFGPFDVKFNIKLTLTGKGKANIIAVSRAYSSLRWA